MCSAGIAILWYYRASSHCKHEMGTLSWSNVKKVPSPLFVRCSSHGCSLQDYIILQAQDLDCVIVTMYDHVLTSCILTVQPNALSTYKSSVPGEHATSVWFLLPSPRQNDVGRDYVEQVCKVMGYMVCAPNMITYSAQSHLTAATKEGAQIERGENHEVCAVYWKNGTTLATKRSIWPLSTLKHCQSRVSFIAFSHLDGQIWSKSLHSSTVHKRPIVQGSLFLLAVYTHEVPAKLQQPTIFKKLLHQALHCPSYSTYVLCNQFKVHGE